MLNAVQKAAYELIQADARFLYTLTIIQRNAKNISSNYIMMSQPYVKRVISYDCLAASYDWLRQVYYKEFLWQIVF